MSINDLSIPTAAAKELLLYQKSFQSGDMQDSMRHLEKALRIDPSISSAHQNLGLCFVRLREYEKAIAEFQTAAKLDDHIVQPEISLAGVFLLEARYDDAETAARRAVAIAPSNLAGRYLLARALMAQGSDTAETRKLLRASAAQYPTAHLLLGNLLLKQNARDQALAEYREYLKQPDAPEKEKVACAIERLSNGSASADCGPSQSSAE